MVAVALALVFALTGWPPHQPEPGEDPPRPLSAREYGAMFIARDTWGMPECSTPRVRVRPNIRDQDGKLVNGQAWIEGCAIEVNDLVVVSRGWVGVCTLIVHEWGHLAGQGHSPDPRSIMYPVSAFEFGPCIEADRRYRCKQLRSRVRRSRGLRRTRLARKWRRVCARQ